MVSLSPSYVHTIKMCCKLELGTQFSQMCGRLIWRSSLCFFPIPISELRSVISGDATCFDGVQLSFLSGADSGEFEEL